MQGAEAEVRQLLERDRRVKGLQPLQCGGGTHRQALTTVQQRRGLLLLCVAGNWRQVLRPSILPGGAGSGARCRRTFGRGLPGRVDAERDCALLHVRQ
eukprot:2352764-Prorocentrum_lima.AAC.1